MGDRGDEGGYPPARKGPPEGSSVVDRQKGPPPIRPPDCTDLRRSRWILPTTVIALLLLGAAGVASYREWHASPAAVPELVLPPGHPMLAAGETLVAPFTLHYAPAENLERIDVALIDGATRTIDMAAYVLTDFPVIQALTRAAGRGVAIRILLDRQQHDDRPEVAPLADLRRQPGVTIRIKASHVYMHMKSYALDGRLLRTGAANFSASGLKQQDNDLVVIENPAAAARFTADFTPAFAAGAAE